MGHPAGLFDDIIEGRQDSASGGMFDDIVNGSAAAPAPPPRRPLPVPAVPSFASDATAMRTPPAPPPARIAPPPVRAPVAPIPIPLAERNALEAAARSGPHDIPDAAGQFTRGLAESGYATAQGAVNLADIATRKVAQVPPAAFGPLAPMALIAQMVAGPRERSLTDVVTGEAPQRPLERAGEAVRESREEMREFYGDPETAAGTVAGVAGNIVGSGAQFMAPGALLTRGAQAVGTGSAAGRAMQFLANPLGGTGARAAVGRAVGGTVLNAPLNAAIAASPEDNTTRFIAEITGSDALREASKNPATAFAVETAVDLAGNAAIEGIAAGVRRLRGKPAFPDTDAPTSFEVRPPAEGGLRRKVAEFVDPTVKDLAEQRNVAQRAAETDELTGLGNQGAYRRALAAAETDPATAVIRFDANGFKGVNDALGHQAGDQTLREMAEAIRTGAGDGARVFRVGGDEFAVLVPTERAADALQQIESGYGVREVAPGVRTSISGGVGDTDAVADAAAIARKAEQKAAQGIGGRAPETPPATPVVEPPAARPADATARLAELEAEYDRLFAEQSQTRGMGALEYVEFTKRPEVQRILDEIKALEGGDVTPAVPSKPASGPFDDIVEPQTAKVPEGVPRETVLEGSEASAIDDAADVAVDVDEGPGAVLRRFEWVHGGTVGGRQIAGTYVPAGSEKDVLGFKLTRRGKKGADLVTVRVVEGPGGTRFIDTETGKPVVVEGVGPPPPAKPGATDDVAAAERAAIEAGEAPDYWKMPLDELKGRVPRAVPTSLANTPDETLRALAAYRLRLAQQDIDAMAQLEQIEPVLESTSTGRKIGYEGAKRYFGTAEDARRWQNVTEEQIGALSERNLTPQDVNAMYKARERVEAGRKAIDRLDAEMEARGLSLADDVDDSFDFVMGHPSRSRGGKPKPSEPTLFAEGTQRSLLGEAPTMAESDVGKRAPKAPEATGSAPEMRGAIGEEEMAARRDELGFEKQEIPGADDPGQGALFAPSGARATPPPPPSPPAAPAPKPGKLDQFGATKELQSELASAALGGVAGAAAAGEDNRTVGALLGAAAGYGAARAGMAGAQAIAKQRALREGVQSLRNINLQMMRAAGVSVEQGRSRILRQSALGWFSPRTEAIRQRRLDALDTGAHELGHYVSKRFFGNPANKKAMGALAGPRIPLTIAQKKELVAAGKRLYGNTKPTGGYGEEGIAEFFKFFVTDPARAKAEFPLSYPAFIQALDTDPNGTAMRQILETAQGQFEKWKQSPAYERVSALVSVDERTAAMPTLADFRRVVEDDLIHAKVAEREMRALTGKPMGSDVSPTDLMHLSRGSAGEAARALDDGIIINGKKVADGIAETFKAVRRRTQDFRMYLIAKRTLEDLLPRGINPGISRAEAEALVAKLEPEMGAHAKKIWAFENAKIRLRESVGLLTKEEADEIIKKNPHHVAFQRVFGADEPQGGKGAGRAKVKASSGVMRIKGSSRQIIDPLESQVKDTYDTFRAVREHQAASALVKMGLDAEGGARWFEFVEAPKVPQSFRLTTETLEQLVDLGVLTADQAADVSGPMMTGRIAGFLRGFNDAARAGMSEAKDMVIPVVLNGERRWVQVKDKGVYEALLGMNAEEMGAIERFVSTWPKWAQAPLTPAKAVARTLRAGATLTTEFIARNPVRDAWGAMVRTRAGRMVVPGEHLYRGVLGLIKKDADYDAWLRSGGANATMVSGDRSVYQKSLRDLQATAAERGWYLVTHPVDFLRAVSEVSENATRLGEFKLVKGEAVKKGVGERAANVRAGAASRDITVDFAKAGQAIREANKIVAFLNAYVQGNINLAKDLVNRPRVVLPRILVGITLPSLAIEALYHDDETYREVPDWVKRTSWVIPIGDSYIAIPKPFELGTLFGTIPQRILGGVLDGDKKAAQRIKRDLVTGFKPPVVPTIAAPLVENFANRSTFTDRPIIPRDKEGEEPFAQAGPRTGETARTVGGMLNVSPAKIENVVRGYTGGLGAYALEGTDAAVRIGRERMGKEPLRPTMPPEREGIFAVPGVRAFVKPNPGAGGQSIEDFYVGRDAAERKRQTYHGLVQEGRYKDAREFLLENLTEIIAMSTEGDFGETGLARSAAQQMDELRAIRKQVMTSPLSKPDRDAKLRQVEQAMTKVARGGNRAMEALSAIP